MIDVSIVVCRNEKVYWSDTIKRKLVEADIDGSNIRTIASQDIMQIGMYVSTIKRLSKG